MIRLPTLRTVGIAGLVAGAAALAAPLVWNRFWPTPIATIDLPEAHAAIAGCSIARGRVLPSTIWRPLWLIDAEDGRGWHPVTRIEPSQGTWQSKTCVRGRTDRKKLALVVVDGQLDEAFKRELIEPETEEIPAWMKPRYTEEQGCPGRRHGFAPLPAGARLVSSVQVRVRDGYLPCHAAPPWVDISGTDARSRWHEQRRDLRTHVGLQGAVVRGVPRGGHRTGGRDP